MKKLTAFCAFLCAVCILLSACSSSRMFRRANGILDKLESVADHLAETGDIPADADVTDVPDIPDAPDAPDDPAEGKVLARPDGAKVTSTPLFWKVSGNGFDGNFYLLGSIHTGPSDLNQYPDEVFDAFNSCDSLAVESDVLAMEEDMALQMKCLKLWIYTDGTKISAHIPPQLYSKAVALMRELGIYNTMMDYYTPVMWQQLIDQTLAESTPFDYDAGADRFFLAAAKKYGKKVIETENPVDTYAALAGLSEATQTLLLEETVSEEYRDSYEEDLAELVNAWMEGNEDTITSLLFTESDDTEYTAEENACFDEYNRVLVDERNAGMTDKAASMLKAGKNVFFVVGLAHMLGETGIVESLRSLGYTVEKVDYAAE